MSLNLAHVGFNDLRETVPHKAELAGIVSRNSLRRLTHKDEFASTARNERTGSSPPIVKTTQSITCPRYPLLVQMTDRVLRR
jgi:hypothetical protein